MNRSKLLEERIREHVDAMVGLHIPNLKVDEIQSDRMGRILTLHTTENLKEDWQQLRQRVLRSTDASAPEGEVSIDGVRYLETIVDVMQERVQELEAEREEEIRFKMTWMETLQGSASESKKKSCRESIEGSERRLEEIDERLSLAEYRHSLAEVMLTQIAVLDRILSWEEYFHLRQNSEEKDIKVSGTIDNQKRTVLIGMALQHFKKTQNGLPSFGSKKNFLKFASELDHHLLSKHGPDTAEGALRDTDKYITGNQGATGNNLRDIMKNCVEYAESHNWSLSEVEQTDLENSVIDAYKSASG